MSLYSETGIGHLIFEMNEEIRHLKARLQRHEEAHSLLVLLLTRGAMPLGPVMPVCAAVRYLEEAHRYGETGAEVTWIGLAKDFKEES